MYKHITFGFKFNKIVWLISIPAFAALQLDSNEEMREERIRRRYCLQEVNT